MLLKVKVAELLNHIEYIEQTCKGLTSSSYPNLRARLQGLLTEKISDYKSKAKKLSVQIENYKTPDNSAFDTWQQLYDELVELASDIQSLRTEEIPIYSSLNEDDFYVSNLLKAIHQEIGFIDVQPIVSLHQRLWFAVMPTIPLYPLYFLPSSITFDPSELPLVFHEMGHILFALRDRNFEQAISVVRRETLERRREEINSEPDPMVRQDKHDTLSKSFNRISSEFEEIVCDIVGALLGGNAFVTALSIGLFSMAIGNPFDPRPPYPPLDYRMRIGGIVLRHLGCDTQSVDYLEENWTKVTSSHTSPRWYEWLYDEKYINDLVLATEVYLKNRGFNLYSDRPGGIRQELDRGLRLMLKDNQEHKKWIHEQAKAFHSAYSSSNSSS